VKPKTYVCPRAIGPARIDGDVTKQFWSATSWTTPFVDILGDSGPQPRYETRVKMLWDDEHLYIAAQLEEPHVWGTLTERDSVIFHDNDFEVFIDPDGDNHLYAELEINALNTVWDLLLVRPYRDGGPAINGWDIKGLQTAVQVQGTLNDPSDVDVGWSAEIALPFKALKEISAVSCPPAVGHQWRINFSRVQWEHDVVAGKYRKVPDKPEANWVWSPQPAVDMHRPEAWGILQFGNTAADTELLYPGLEEREALMSLYYAQREYRKRNGSYAQSLADLAILDSCIKLSASANRWEARLAHWSIDESSRILS
jgi:hypothetical protein